MVIWWGRVSRAHQGRLNGINQVNRDLVPTHSRLTGLEESSTKELWSLPVPLSQKRVAPTLASPVLTLKSVNVVSLHMSLEWFELCAFALELRVSGFVSKGVVRWPFKRSALISNSPFSCSDAIPAGFHSQML